jgi:hypothetical protein
VVSAPPKSPRSRSLPPSPPQRPGPFYWSLASELMALNKTLQPESSVGDRRDTSYGVGHMQEVRLQPPRNVVPKDYCGGSKLGQCCCGAVC